MTHHHSPPHLIRPPSRPALHRHYAWIEVQTRTWRGKQHVDLGLLARYQWVMRVRARRTGK